LTMATAHLSGSWLNPVKRDTAIVPGQE